jgi:hypothetical protein
MVQQTLPFRQSLSALQNVKPLAAGSHCFWAVDAKLIETQACPCAVSHVVSAVQYCGQELADWHTLPADP